MGDATVKPSDGDDLVLSNNDGTSKLELNEDQTVKVATGSDAGEDFMVNTTQLVVEGDSGNIGIGTATPASSQSINKVLHIVDATHASIRIQDSSGSNLEVFSNVDSEIRVSTNTQLILGTNDTQRLTIEAAGDVKLNTGNLVIGAAGKGIDFSDSQTPTTTGTTTGEILDHYEVGTFVAIPADASGNTDTTDQVTGQYTKVGRMVTIQFGKSNVETTGLVTTDVFRVNGLPFTSNTMASGNQGWVGVASTARIPHPAETGIVTTPYVVLGQSYIQFWRSQMDSFTGDILVSDINSGGSDYQVSITYFTA